MKRKLLSVGQNMKLGKDVSVFNLPRGITCPGKTKICDSICYADKAERMYKTAREKRLRNYKASLRPDFVDLITAELKAPLRYHRKTKVATFIHENRWHESGDVYDQTYLDKIFQVCRNTTPQITHLMYTKSFHLDWSQKPDNLKVLWSIDATTTATVPAGATAALVLKGVPPPPGAVTCQHTATAHYCGTQCNICWTGGINVYFPKH